jgi:predicted  nucleic acid-binding Zn-ribbon protein
MSKKLEGDVKIIADLVNTRIDDVINRNIEFEKRAEKKLDDTRLIVKDEISIVHKRLDKIEEKQEQQIKSQFKIEELEKDVNNIKTELKGDIKRVDDKIESHKKDHSKREPKQAVSNFMTKIIWGTSGLVAGGVLLYIIIEIIKKL